MSSAIPSFAFPDMNTPQLPDKMDVASSPFPQADYLDVDIDPFRDPSVIEDEMIDYQDDLVDQKDGLMQDQPDDDMIDQASTAPHDFDYNMESFVEQPPPEEDDILYEDDEDNNDDIGVEPRVDQSVSTAPATDNQPNPDSLNYQDHSQHEDTPAAEELNRDKTQDNSALVHRKDHIEGSTNSHSPQLDEQQHLDSPSGQQEQILGNLEPQEELLLDESEIVEKDFSAQQQEDNYAEQTGHNDSPLLPDTTHAISDAHSEDVRETNEPKAQKALDVHPVTLVYLEEEMSLFPPTSGDDSSVYFLSDPSLAFESLDKLLAACREILTGTLDHHDELVLDVPGLGLHICEDSKYSTKISLADVLEVYLNLCHNDVDSPSEPLYCHLSSRVSLGTQFSYLTSAGADGKTYAEIVADHVDTPLEDSIHVDSDEHFQKEQDQHVNITEHQSKQVELEEEASEYPLASDVEDQVQSSEDILDRHHSPENPIEGVHGHPQPQDPGTTVLGQDQLAETLAPAHNLNLGEDEQQHNDFDTLDDEDQEAGHDSSNYEQVHEIETNSSHTVEAYRDDIEDQGPYEEEVEGDLFDLTNQDQHDLSDQQEHADYGEQYDEEATFAEGEVDREVDAPTSTLSAAELHGQTLSATLNQESLEEEDPAVVGLDDLDDLDDDTELGPPATDEDKVSIEPSPPITPSKAKLAKRKVEADEELDFLDISTPEPKRRRPS